MYTGFLETKSLYHKENHFYQTKSSVYYLFNNPILTPKGEPLWYNQK
jgi:hypothetical protein